MTPSLSRAALSVFAALVFTFAVHAQTDKCGAALTNAAYSEEASGDEARLRCDVELASTIRDKAEKLYGVHFDSVIEIVDTASPSGAAYVYDVLANGDFLSLDARSVPDGKGQRCRLQAVLPHDMSGEVKNILERMDEAHVPGYGPREDVTINPDGSRSVRLVLQSHDIVTRAETSSGTRYFSRHAGSDDLVNRLNNLVIGLANVSPGWVCNAP